ncbi:response regulator [Candidatus Sumerlaeota bacterium]|nr:response regulator [Candidatus Sumerlaeota bacterium]
MKIRLLIVDDEPLARERARRLLDRAQDIDIVGECANGTEAFAAIEKLQPDVVLLDINMPGLDGLRLVEALDDPPAIIFATAHDHHAVQAFELEAADYLLKPFSAERLKRALDRVRQQFALA